MSIASLLKDLLYPRLCAGCGEVLRDGEAQLCAECRAQIALTEEAWHRGNALEQLFRSYAPYGRDERPGDKLVRGAAYSYYHRETAIRAVIRTMKFRRDPMLARWLGQEAARHVLQGESGECFFADVDLLLPIPLHSDRLRERGFNQSERIAQGISDVTGIVVDTTHLVRTVATEQQSRKTLRERAELGTIFAVERPEELRGRHVMLVDDVVTSGTTLARAMEVLHPVRGCTYSVFVLALARHNGSNT